MSDGGKGSSPRPFSVSQEQFANNFDRIFRKPDRKVIEDAELEDEAFKSIEEKQIKEAWNEIENEIGIYDGSLRSNTDNWK